MTDFGEERVPPRPSEKDASSADAGRPDSQAEDASAVDSGLPPGPVFSIHNCADFGKEMLECFSKDCRQAFGREVNLYLRDYFEYVCTYVYTDEGDDPEFFADLQDTRCRTNEMSSLLNDIRSGRSFLDLAPDDELRSEFNSAIDLCSDEDVSNRLNENRCAKACETIIECFGSDDSDSIFGRDVIDDQGAWCDEVCMIMDYPGQGFFACINELIPMGCGPKPSRYDHLAFNSCLSTISSETCSQTYASFMDCYEQGEQNFCNANCRDKCSPSNCYLDCLGSSDCITDHTIEYECIWSNCLGLNPDSECSDHAAGSDLLAECESNCITSRCEITSDTFSNCSNAETCFSQCENSIDCLGRCTLSQPEFNPNYSDSTESEMKIACHKAHLFNYHFDPSLMSDCVSEIQPYILDFIPTLTSDIFLCYEDEGDIYAVCEDACNESNDCDEINEDSSSIERYFANSCNLICSSGVFYQYPNLFECYFDEGEACIDCDSIFEEIFAP